MRNFASIFRDVAHAREGGWSADLPRFHLRENVFRADDELAAQIANAPAPFWGHVRDALAASVAPVALPKRCGLHALARSAPAQEFGEGGSGQAVGFAEVAR